MLIALVSGGFHIDFRTKNGCTAMHIAAAKSNYEAVKVMCHKNIFLTPWSFGNLLGCETGLGKKYVLNGEKGFIMISMGEGKSLSGFSNFILAILSIFPGRQKAKYHNFD